MGRWEGGGAPAGAAVALLARRLPPTCSATLLRVLTSRFFGVCGGEETEQLQPLLLLLQRMLLPLRSTYDSTEPPAARKKVYFLLGSLARRSYS